MDATSCGEPTHLALQLFRMCRRREPCRPTGLKIQDEEADSSFKIPLPLRQACERRQRIQRNVEDVSVLAQIQKRAAQQLGRLILFTIDPQTLALGVDPRLGLERENVALLG